MAVFEKGERLRHIGHLDIQRAMQRALRRAELPVAYSKGFNPHILVSFASALSTGAVGKKEIMDVTMAGEVSAERFLQAMNHALTPEMQLSSARLVDDKHPAYMSLLQGADYTLTLEDAEIAAKCEAAIPDFLAQSTIPAMRKTKSGMKETDIRPLIFSLSADGAALHAILALTADTSCKPDMLLTSLCAFAGVEPPRMLVVRNGLLGRDDAGTLVPLETL